jgi:hypothetical protein
MGRNAKLELAFAGRRYGSPRNRFGRNGMMPIKICRVNASDLLTIIEDVGFGKAMIAGADERGIVIDGYLDLTGIADRVNSLIEIRARSQQLLDSEQPR